MLGYICLITSLFFFLINDIDAFDLKSLKGGIIEVACQKDKRLPFCDNGKSGANESVQRMQHLQKRENLPIRELKKTQSDNNLMLKKYCLDAQLVVSKHCNGIDKGESERAKCKAYFRDCMRYIPHMNPLHDIGKAYNSQVDVSAWHFTVNGIPYYLINEEGGIGAQQELNVPFGTWGGNYKGHIGVRDYWLQYQEAGANWYDGLYGYQSGWSVPIVQSLGAEGYGGTRVAVPLHNHNFGRIGVDNGYGVGGYYAGNNHVGVNWKEGQVNNQLGIKIPFVDVGYGIGQAVAFPSVETFEHRLLEPQQ